MMREYAAPRRAATWLFPGLMLLAIGFVAPLGEILWISVRQNGKFSLAAYAAAFGSRAFWEILLRTARVAVVVTLTCAAAGYPFAYCVATRVRRHGGWIMSLVAVPYLTSVLIRSYAWVAILGNNGPINRTLISIGVIREPLPLVFSVTGSYIGLVHVLLPMLILPTYAAMKRIDRSLPEAGANLGATPIARFVTIFLPLSLPGLMVGSALVLLATLGAYVTPALLGAPGDYLLAQAIQVRIDTLGEFDTASAQAIVLLVLVAGLLLLFRGVILPEVSASRGPSVTPRRRFAWLTSGAVSRGASRLAGATAVLETLAGPLLIGYSGLLLVVILLPIAVVMMIAFTNAPYLQFPPPSYSTRWFTALAGDRNWLDSLIFSLQISTAAAATALIAGAPYAMTMVRGNLAGRRALWLLAIAPMVLPQIIIGLGIFFVCVAIHVNGTAVGFWFGYSVIGLPYVITILAAGFSQFDSTLERAAANLGARPLTVFLTVSLPVLAMSFIAAFLFAFLAGFDDLVISLFLSSPRHTTLAMRMWEDIQLEISPKTAVVGFLQLVVLLGGASTIAARRGLKWRESRRREIYESGRLKY